MITRFLDFLNSEDGSSQLIESSAFVYDQEQKRVVSNLVRFQVNRDFQLPAKPWLLPVGFDIHVHFRVPGLEHKEDFKSGSKAALFGGVLGVGDMPNTKPPVLSVNDLRVKKARSFHESVIDIRLGVAVTDENIDSLSDVYREADFLKLFVAESFGNLSISLKNIQRVFKEASRSDVVKPVVVHAEDPMLIHETVNPEDHERMRPEEAEVSAVRMLLRLKENYPGMWLHLTHLSSEESLKLVWGYRQRNPNDKRLSTDVTPAHFEFSLNDAMKSPSFFKMNPPVRREETRRALFQALRHGKIDVVSSDHAPHLREEKQQAKPPSGAPGVQETYYVLLHHVLTGQLPLDVFMSVFHDNPLRMFPQWKAYQEYYVLIDPNSTFKFTSKDVKSKAGWSLWEGRVFQGKLLGIVKQEKGYYQIYEFHEAS